MADHPDKPGAKLDKLLGYLRERHGVKRSLAALQWHARNHDADRYERAKIR